MKEERNASNPIGRKRVKREMSGLFHLKKPRTLKKCAWRHKFFCLAYIDQEKSPTCEADKDELYRAGLGEKEITFEDATVSQEEFYEIILDNYPRLRQGGGFRFLKGKITIHAFLHERLRLSFLIFTWLLLLFLLRVA